MAKRMTESEVIEKIKSLLPDTTKFLGWVNNEWKGIRKTTARYFCSKHNSYFESRVDNAIGDSRTPKCVECKKETYKESAIKSRGITEEEAINKIKSILPNNIEFKGWKEGKWLGTKKNSVVLHCTTHDVDFNIIYRYLITLDKDLVKCPKCVDRSKAGEFITERNKQNILSLEEAKDRLDKFFKQNQDLELASEMEYCGLMNTKVKLRCKKHNTIIEASLCTILNNIYLSGQRRYHCPDCFSEEISNSRKLSPQEAYDMVIEKFKDIDTGYDYSKIKTTYNERTKKVTVTCPKHGDFEVTFSTLMSNRERKTFNGMCPECYKELYCISEQDALSKIQEGIDYRNQELGYNLSFMGFVGGKWKGTDTKLILKCNVHNSIQDTISYSEFVSQSKLLVGCKQCCSSHKTSNAERLCKIEIEKYISADKIETQRLYRIYDDVCNVDRRVYVDFYIKDLNLIIEYDGEQHFKFLSIFQDNYSLFVNQVNRDKCLNRYCKEKSINLLRISFKDQNRLEEVIKSYFEEGKDITTKVDPILLPIKY